MKPLQRFALDRRVRYWLAKDGATLFGDRAGGVIVVRGETARHYPSLETLAREMNCISDYEYVVQPGAAPKALEGHVHA